MIRRSPPAFPGPARPARRRSVRGVIRLLALIVTFVFTAPPAIAKDLDVANAACREYAETFPQRCRCAGDKDEYFTTYGLRYCNRFLESADFSAAGRRWRSRTLACLTKRITRELEGSARDRCNCAEMRKVAFESHVECYTLDGASVCGLPPGDIVEIIRVIDTADLLLTSEGWAQALAVATRCSSRAPVPASGIEWR